MAAAHYVFYSTETGEAKHCAVGKKAERAIEDISRAGLKYAAREREKNDCPFCNPPRITPADGPEPAAPPAMLDDETPEPVKPGQCLGCRGSRFSLSYKVKPRVLVRICGDCGAGFDLQSMTPTDINLFTN